MNYEISLRKAEAELIEVVNEEEAKEWAAKNEPQMGIIADECGDILSRVAREKEHEISTVFVGNPNCGKTSLFNMACGAHERVGNYSGVTVDAKEGKLDFMDYHIHCFDLPGTYSLSTYTPEELYVRKYIIEQHPDIIVNVIDASNIERNLYLTTQLIDMDVPMVIALNMYDELQESGNQLDIAQLGTLLGAPIVPTIARTGEGVKELFKEIIETVEGKQKIARHIHINHGSLLETNISKIEQFIRKNPEPHQNYSVRFLSIKLLENDRQVKDIVKQLPNSDEILAKCSECQEAIQKEIDEDSESAITDAKYGYIQGALKETFKKVNKNKRMLTKRIDAIVTHQIWGFPIFFLLMYLMFFCTFNIGQYPMDWIEAIVGWIGDKVSLLMPEGPLKDLIVSGIIDGVGGVIVFLPNIMILYMFISWMEDSGYMSRAAFIMDKIMHRMGLHGKSFIPMIMGFGCNIPAIMATRTIEDRKSRLITMLIIPFMSCSARLPVYIIIITAFAKSAHPGLFAHSALMLLLMYMTGIIVSVVMAKLLSRYIVKGESSPFVMELPPYRMPSLVNVSKHTWEKGKQYLRKMGTTILAASIAVWALSYFPHDASLNEEQQIEQSYIGQVGKFIEPVIAPCGMQWKEGVAIVAGAGAKEIVASTMSVLYHGDIANSGITPLAAFCFMLFVLLYMPCLAACVAIKNESGKWKWAIFTAVYTTCLAWLLSMIVYQIGQLLCSTQ